MTQIATRCWRARNRTGSKLFSLLATARARRRRTAAFDWRRNTAGSRNIQKSGRASAFIRTKPSLANDAAYGHLEQWARHPKVIAWGEIGLDYFYDHSPREFRRQVFRQQMELARAAKLPIIIHCRPSDNSENAWDDCLKLIAEHWTSSGLGGILHCFTGIGEARSRGLDLGFMISFAGNITFPKAQSIREAAQIVPLDRMLIETDSPYLAPIPHRGKRNEPAFVDETARQIGELARPRSRGNWCGGPQRTSTGSSAWAKARKPGSARLACPELASSDTLKGYMLGWAVRGYGRLGLRATPPNPRRNVCSKLVARSQSGAPLSMTI